MHTTRSVPGRHAWRLLAAVVVGLLVSAGTVAIRPAYAEDSPAERTFKSLDEATEAGAIDATTVTALRKKRKVQAFAILEGEKIVASYGSGDKAGIAASAAMLKELRDAVLARTDITAVRTYTLVPDVLVSLTSETAALRLLNDVAVRSIAADNRNQLWLEDSLPLIRQPALAAGGADGRGVTVVTMDTGADLTQPEFGSCTAPGVPAGCRVPVMLDTAPDDGTADDNGHGTNTSAIAAGVAPGAQVVPIDVFDGSGVWDHDSIAALDWVLLNRFARNIRAVNMSFGVGTHTNTNCGGDWFHRNPYQWAFQGLRGSGVLPVVSAGNNATSGGTFTDGIGYPACTLGAIPVGATYTVMGVTQVFSSCTDVGITLADTVTCFSQDSSLLDVLAPGVDIDAAGIQMSGTSQAAPHVTGAAAVLAQVSPFSTSDDLRSFLQTSDTTVLDGRTGRFHPRLDLTAAVRAAVPVTNDNQATARVLAGWGGRTAQSTWGATKEPGEPSHAGNAGGSSVWYRWTPSQTSSAMFTTDGSDFDTLLAVYRSAGGALTLLGQNDNAGTGVTSTVTVGVTAGDTILVAVDGARAPGAAFAASGQVRLTWNLPNDQIAQAITLPPVDTIFGVSTTGSNVSATKEAGEQHHCGDLYSTASVWYRYNTTVTQQIRVRASSTRLLCAAVYGAPASIAVPAFNQLVLQAAGADDQGPAVDFTFTASPGTSYWIAVDGVSVEQNCTPYGTCFYTTPTAPFLLTLT